MAATDNILLEVRPSAGRFLLSVTVWLVLPLALAVTAAYWLELRQFTFLRRPVLLLIPLAIIYLVASLQFLFRIPGIIRITEHRMDMTDRADNLMERAVRWQEVETVKQLTFWGSKWQLKTYQDRVYTLRNWGIDAKEWEQLGELIVQNSEAAGAHLLLGGQVETPKNN